MSVAIVTGGAKGIGAATAMRLARDGFKVAIFDLDNPGQTAWAISADTGVDVRGYRVDVTDDEAVAVAVGRVAEDLGEPTVLVNNAGITRDKSFTKMSLDEWHKVMTVNLESMFIVSKAVVPYMIKAGYGRIINVSSTSALGNFGQANYAASKAGVQGFTKTLAIELGRKGITANAVAPHFVETEMVRSMVEGFGIDFAEWAATEGKKVPAGRIGQPEDVADVISFFASEDSRYVNGQVLYVAGGPRA